ncbi:transmembrane protein 214 [Pogona vitticeps]
MAAAAAGSGAGRWEVVRKPARRGAASGGGGGGGGAAGRKALGEANAGRAAAPPLAASETLFELGFERARKKQNKEQVPPPPGAAKAPPPPQKPPPSGRKNARKVAGPGERAPQPPGRFRSLEEALGALDLSELQKQLEKSQSLFPENPSVWVKDMAGYLNYKLQAPKSDPTLSQHPHDYPYCLVSKDLRTIIKSLLSKAGGVLELFFDHCIYTMLQELDKTPGESLHGYRICIQALLVDKPKVATANLSKYLELLRCHHNRTPKCLTIMWALGQAGFADLTEGLKVWLGIMLPVLGLKSLSPFAITYLDRLLMMHPNLTKGFGMIGPKDFFPLLDFAFMPNNSLSPSLQEQLQQLYPRLKVLAFGAKPEATLHTYFPSFLSRTTPNCPTGMRKELLSCLMECLTLDPLSFSVWRQLYIKHLSQSSLLLNHYLETWDSTSKKVRKSLQETVHSFKVTNDELAAKGPSSAEDVAACRAACQSLLLKMKAGGPPWPRLALVLLVFIAGFLMHDVRTHGSFQASASARVLRSCGILPASQQAWNTVSHLSMEGYSWLEAKAPLCYTRVTSTLAPNLELAWAKILEMAADLSGKCSAQLVWLSDHLPRFTEWLQARVPEFVLCGAEYLKELLLFLMKNCFLPAVDYLAAALEGAWQRWADSCDGEGSWECLRTQLTSLVLSSWGYLQDTPGMIKDWASGILSGH